jgi:hypothetical protein
MDQNRGTTWDITIKALLLIGTAIGSILALLEYNWTTEKEFRRPFWNQQVALYFKAAETAGKIASLPSAERGKPANSQEFWNLYFGPLVVVEDDELVCRAMVDFGDCLPRPGAAYSKDKCDDPEIQHPRSHTRHPISRFNWPGVG